MRSSAICSLQCLRLRSRRGFTVIEMVTVCVLFSAAMAMSLSILNHLVQITQATTVHGLLVRELDRCAASLRESVHDCQEATVADEGRTLSLLFADGRRHQFSLTEQGMSFQATGAIDRDSASGAASHADVFLIAPTESARFFMDDARRVVRLLVREQTRARPRIQVEAAIPTTREGDES